MSSAADWFGVVNLNKPAGMSSRKAVDRVKRLVKPAKVGHAGTLDPIATGVLVVCVGPATRLIRHAQEKRKSYRAKFLLGRTSRTDDIEAELTVVVEDPIVTEEDILNELTALTGTIQQTPPKFSAVHVEGKRAYELARKGQEVEIQPRPVEVHRIDLVELAAPQLVLEIECGPEPIYGPLAATSVNDWAAGPS